MEEKKEYYNVTQLFEMCIENILSFGFITIRSEPKIGFINILFCFFIFTTPVGEKDQ